MPRQQNVCEGKLLHNLNIFRILNNSSIGNLKKYFASKLVVLKTFRLAILQKNLDVILINQSLHSTIKYSFQGECSICGSFHSCPLFGPKSVENKPRGRQNIKLYFNASPRSPFCSKDAFIIFIRALIVSQLSVFHVFVTIDVGRKFLTKSMPASVVSLLLVGEYETTEIVMFRPRYSKPNSRRIFFVLQR